MPCEVRCHALAGKHSTGTCLQMRMDWNRIAAIANIGCFLAGCFALYDAHSRSSGGFTMYPLTWLFAGGLLGAGILHFAAAGIQTRKSLEATQGTVPASAPETIAKPLEPSLPKRTPLEDSRFCHLKVAFGGLTIPQQYAMMLIVESERPRVRPS